MSFGGTRTIPDRNQLFALGNTDYDHSGRNINAALMLASPMIIMA